MKNIAINRLNIISAQYGEGLNFEQKISLLKALGEMGYRVNNPEMMDTISPAFLMDYQHLLDALKKKRGGDVDYVPLFKKFTTRTESDNSYLLKRIVGYVANALNIKDNCVQLDNGVIVPNWLFDVYEFGADPITQMQSKELYIRGVQEEKEKKSDSHTEWIDLEIMHDEDALDKLKSYLENLLYSRSSIKEALHSDVFRMLNFFGTEKLDFSRIAFKETKALVLKYCWKEGNFEIINQLAKTPTDVLRMFAAITDTDISLAQKIKFPKLNRKVRKVVLSVLERSSNLGDELLKYKGLWLELGRYIHPTEYTKQFPKTAKMFDQLRNGKIETFNSKTEKYLVQKEFGLLMKHLSNKPGVFARRFHEILRKFPNEQNQLLSLLAEQADKIEVKNLLTMAHYFDTINESEYRTVVNKKGRIKILKNNSLFALEKEDAAKVSAKLRNAITQSFQEKEQWKDQKVWIAPELENYTVPLQERAASDGIITIGRGSRINIDFDKVLRLFIYWKEAGICTDLDLSVIQFDAEFKYQGHVSYTNLKSGGITHSGDIQSAPHGAAEFIDITMKSLPSHVKYLAVQVYKYSGSNFSDIQCHAGWMMRKDVNPSIKTFDIKTVANKFDLNGKGTYAIPLIVDIESKQIIFSDLFVSGKAMHNNVEGAQNDISLICSQVSEFVRTKPNMGSLAALHTIGRNATFASEKAAADITFGLKDCTYNATDTEKILAELI